MKFDDKDPDEIEYVGFNFLRRLGAGEAITAATFHAAVVSGTDPAPENILIGASQIEGSVVRHKVGGGVAGVHYRVSVHADTSAGQKLIESASLVVKDVG